MPPLSERPNFLVFVADQLQSFYLGCNGGSRSIQTPNIDRIAESGVTFRRAYCNNPLCTPSRATMITGLSPRQHGCITNGMRLSESVPTITQALVDSGYRTHAVGKLHYQPFFIGGTEKDGHTPLSWESQSLWGDGGIARLPLPYYGFQSVDYIGGHTQYVYGDYANWLKERDPAAHSLLAKENAYSTPQPEGQTWRMSIPEELHYNHWIADKAIAFLDSATPGEPFFLWCSFPDPHHPFAACRPYSEQYDPRDVVLNPTWDFREDPCSCLAQVRRIWRGAVDFSEPQLREIASQTYGMVSHLDASLGRVVDHLTRRGLDSSTVVVFMSDHGEYLGSHHLLFKSLWPWEELLRIPFVWRPPGANGARPPSEMTTSLLDFAPTVLDYAEIPAAALCAPRAGKGDRPWPPGRSLRPFLDGGEPLPPLPVLVEYDEDWEEGPMWRARTLIDGAHKITVFAPFGEGLLFDLDGDPHETRNLWDSPDHAALKTRLLHALVETMARTDRLDGARITGA